MNKHPNKILIKDNWGLKAGTRFIYLACPDLYMIQTSVNGSLGGHSNWRFTPAQMDGRYFVNEDEWRYDIYILKGDKFSEANLILLSEVLKTP